MTGFATDLIEVRATRRIDDRVISAAIAEAQLKSE
jgi:hypothetical protein